jgi:hypothetical protein
MRKTLSFVALLALTLTGSVALADDAPATLPAPTAEPPVAAAPADALPLDGALTCPTVDPLGNPAAKPTFVSSGPCYVQRQCDDSSTISCNGSSSCSSGPGTGGGYVTCDGQTTWCLYVPPPTCEAEGTFCKYNGTVCGECDGWPCYCYNRSCVCV